MLPRPNHVEQGTVMPGGRIVVDVLNRMSLKSSTSRRPVIANLVNFRVNRFFNAAIGQWLPL